MIAIVCGHISHGSADLSDQWSAMEAMVTTVATAMLTAMATWVTLVTMAVNVQ
jgi:hypothetical protein